MSEPILDYNRMPQHIAIIMDGNGRWAKQHGKERVFGHKEGANAVRRTVQAAGELRIPYLTLYAFSTENWNRPRAEVEALMSLLISAIHHELDNLMENQVRLNAIGNLDDLPTLCRNELQSAIEKTSQNKGLTLTLALSYSGRWELTAMAKNIAKLVESGKLKSEEISEQNVIAALNTYPIPDPDILIRTGGECRISNFLLWQIAYAELFFTPIMWPEFSKNELVNIISQFQSRERRFGKTSEQVKSC